MNEGAETCCSCDHAMWLEERRELEAKESLSLTLLCHAMCS